MGVGDCKIHRGLAAVHLGSAPSSAVFAISAQLALGARFETELRITPQGGNGVFTILAIAMHCSQFKEIEYRYISVGMWDWLLSPTGHRGQSEISWSGEL